MSSASPTRKQAIAATDDRVGSDDANSAFENTISAVKPISPGSKSRNGVTEARKALPKTSGINGGPSTALRSKVARVSYAADPNGFSLLANRGSGALFAAS